MSKLSDTITISREEFMNMCLSAYRVRPKSWKRIKSISSFETGRSYTITHFASELWEKFEKKEKNV